MIVFLIDRYIVCFILRSYPNPEPEPRKKESEPDTSRPRQGNWRGLFYKIGLSFESGI